MKPVVLFGLGKIAEVVHHFMSKESPREVVGWTCDAQFLDRDTFHGLPAVAFEEVTEKFPPEQFDMFVALGYQNLNSLRAERVHDAKQKGYSLPSFVHEKSGLPVDTDLGDNCFIMNSVCVHPRVRLGDDVFVWSGAMIGHHSTIADHCWITSTANICGVVEAGASCFFAANATVANNVRIGKECFLGSNTLVTKDLPDQSVVIAEASKPMRISSHQFMRMTAMK